MRYGYRRVHVLLRREGWGINHKKTYRIYREMGLQLRNKTPKRRVKAKLREDRKAATGPNQTWAMDFVRDQLATGRKLRVLTVVDIFSRFTGDRFALHVSRRGRGPDPGAGLRRGSVIRRRSGSIREASSSRGISTCGHTPGA